MEMIERIQYQAAFAITGTWSGSSRLQLYEEFEWECLSERRRVLHVHKIYNNMSPSKR